MIGKNITESDSVFYSKKGGRKNSIDSGDRGGGGATRIQQRTTGGMFLPMQLMDQRLKMQWKMPLRFIGQENAQDKVT